MREIKRLSGADIRFMRQVRGVDQSTLAKACGVSVQTISQIEQGRRPLVPAYELAIAKTLFPEPSA